MNSGDVKKLNIPIRPGCYLFKDKDGKIIYVGKAANLRSRVSSYWRQSANHSPAKYSMMKNIARLEWIETDSEIEALLLEANLIKKYQPQYNVVMRDDKRYVYIKVSLGDEVPGVFITRKIDRAGRYFGPFVSAGALKDVLRAVRKIWPYCATRKIQPKPCFYYEIGRCPGACGRKISREEYLDKYIKPIILFFEGRKKKIIAGQATEIKALRKLLAAEKEGSAAWEEKAARIKELEFHLANMKQVLEHTKVISLLDKYSADVVELAKILGLPKAPARIEGYDISNIFSLEAVGSMVVFAEGESDKNNYRKFKIKASEDSGDIGMLKEVLERRFARSADARPDGEPVWPLPDLIIIDGGKGQLNAALKILKRYKLDIPAIAVSKGRGLRSAAAPDKLFFPGEKKPLVLPLASPALHLIKRVRDEAHRFAIKYHRELRARRIVG